MADRINMSLDDVIKHDKGGKPRGGSRGGFRGISRRGGRQRGFSRERPFGGRKFARPVRPVSGRGAEAHRNKRFEKPTGGRGQGTERRLIRRTGRAVTHRKEDEEDTRRVYVKSRTLLKVSNLDTKLTNTELFELFSAIGSLRLCQIDYDNLGRSKHTAKIEFELPERAKKAIEEYNGSILDGKTLEVKYAEIQKDVPRIRRREEFRREEPDHSRRSDDRGEGFGRRRRFNFRRGRFNDRRRPREDLNNRSNGN